MNLEKHEFNADVGNVLSLVINSIYTNKDIFLRELISNASDACDKLRFLAIENPDLASDYKISVLLDKSNRHITIQDNGIGMNAEDLALHLGTIAKSGTKAFLEKLEKSDKPQLIGQFGVGFYSAFMVADKVSVYSHKADDKSGKTYVWESDGKEGYTLGESQEEVEKGTKIVLHIKPSESSFLDKYHLRHIIQTYSEHISFPIELVDLEEGAESERVNKGSALWTRARKDISQEEYNSFYRSISYLPGDPWLTIHNTVEGKVTYTSLLFIPDIKPFDLFHHEGKTKIKLYIKKVFITDDAVKLLPSYLRFIRGVVDSDDLPLNISRETLQHSYVIDQIRQSIVRKVFVELAKKAESDSDGFTKFWNNFGEVLKEGLCEPNIGEDKEILLDLCHFYSSKSPGNLIRLSDYVKSMQDEQKDIYYLLGDSIGNMQSHPQLEEFTSKGIEVLYLTHRADDFWVQVIPEYKGKIFTSITKAGIELNDKPKEDKQEVIGYFASVLGDKVKEVMASAKLGEKSPVCLSLPEGQMSSRIENILLQQNQLNSRSKKVLEVNLRHPIIKKIADGLQKGEKHDDVVHILYAQACLIEGEPIENPYIFAEQLNRFILSEGI